MRSHEKFTNFGPPPNQMVKNLFFSFCGIFIFYLLGKVSTIHYVHVSEEVQKNSLGTSSKHPLSNEHQTFNRYRIFWLQYIKKVHVK